MEQPYATLDGAVHRHLARLVPSDVPLLTTTEEPVADDSENEEPRVIIRTPDELRSYLWNTWHVKIPDKKVCEHHSSPWEAFCDCYFARHRVVVIKGSRGLAGKTWFFGILGLVEATTLNANVLLMGGSDLQSRRVLQAMERFWKEPNAPRELLKTAPAQSETKFKHGNNITAIPHSQKAARGPHPHRLRCDEVDEMDLEILNAALGTTMSSDGIAGQTALASTHQYAEGTFTDVMKRVVTKGWKFHEWCYRETVQPNGWLPQSEIDAKRVELTDSMWRIEVEGEEPTAEGRAITPEAVDAMFDTAYGEEEDVIGKYYEFEEPDLDGLYAHAADWGKRRDFSAIPTLRYDCEPRRFVAFYRDRKKPYRLMAPNLNERMERYGGKGIHDANGVGEVVGEYLTHDVEAYTSWQGEARSTLFNNYINAIEKGRVKAPRVKAWYRAHKYVLNDDLFGKGHPPDEFVACALAWKRANSRELALV